MQWWEIGLLAIVLRAANELNDLSAQENPSHTAIATRPASASEIRYTVMLASLVESNVRHDAYQAIISGANPIPPSAIRMADRRGGAACERGLKATPRAGTFARAS